MVFLLEIFRKGWHFSIFRRTCECMQEFLDETSIGEHSLESFNRREERGFVRFYLKVLH